jgi:hypothetical protein
VLDLARKSNELGAADPVGFAFEGCKDGARGFDEDPVGGDDQLRSRRSSMVVYVCIYARLLTHDHSWTG